jgi:hypothetical protein
MSPLLEVDAFEEVLGGNGLEAVGVGLDQGVGEGIGHGSAGVQVVVLEFGLIELIVLEALTESVDVVHVGLEGGAPGIFRGVGAIGGDTGVVAGGAAAGLVAGKFSAHHLAIHGVAVVDGLECGPLLRGQGHGSAGAVEAKGARTHLVSSGDAEAELAGLRTFAVVAIDIRVDQNRLHGAALNRDGPGAFELEADLGSDVAERAEVGVERVAGRAENQVVVGIGVAHTRLDIRTSGIVDGTHGVAEKNGLPPWAVDFGRAMRGKGDAPAGGQIDRATAVGKAGGREWRNVAGGGCVAGGGDGRSGVLLPGLGELAQQNRLGFGEAAGIVVKDGGSGLRAAREGDKHQAGQGLARLVAGFRGDQEERAEGLAVAAFEDVAHLGAVAEVAMDVAQDGEHSPLRGGLVGDRTVHDLASAGVVDDLESALRQGGTEARTGAQKDGGRVRKTSDAGPDHRHSDRSLGDYGEGTIVGPTAMGQDSPGVALCQSICETMERRQVPSKRLGESKAATTVITSLRDDEESAICRSYQRNLLTLSTLATIVLLYE